MRRCTCGRLRALGWGRCASPRSVASCSAVSHHRGNFHGVNIGTRGPIASWRSGDRGDGLLGGSLDSDSQQLGVVAEVARRVDTNHLPGLENECIGGLASRLGLRRTRLRIGTDQRPRSRAMLFQMLSHVPPAREQPACRTWHQSARLTA